MPKLAVMIGHFISTSTSTPLSSSLLQRRAAIREGSCSPLCAVRQAWRPSLRATLVEKTASGGKASQEYSAMVIGVESGKW
ncbi:hypothetical protein E4U34_002598 [Claviceps purpurea]|nr:hypothetical protein E4U34_002598 [Claviceps purpurea]